MTWSSGGVVQKSSIRKLPNIKTSNTKSLCDEGSFIIIIFSFCRVGWRREQKKMSNQL